MHHSEKKMEHSDMPTVGWWRLLPDSMQPYVYLGRFDRPIGWWLLLLPSWWIIPLGTTSINKMLWLMTLFLIGAIVTRAAGCVVNDLWDRRLDQQVERTRLRPLASGSISVFSAFFFLIFLGGISVTVLLQLPFISIIIGFAAIPLVVLYPLTKRITWFPQFFLGLTFSWGIPLGWTASNGTLPDLSVLFIYFGCIAWVFGYDTIYAVQDMSDDVAVGIKSAALAFGKNLRTAVGLAYGIALLLLSVGLYLRLGIGFWLAGISLMGIHLSLQTLQLKNTNATKAMQLFRSNRNAGLILTAAILSESIFN